MPRDRRQRAPPEEGNDERQLSDVKPLEKKPHQPITDYIRYFKRVVVANNWTDDHAGRVFAAMLGSDDRILDSIEGQWTTFTELQELLLETQKPLRMAHLAELMSLRHSHDQDFFELRDRVSRLVALCYPEFTQDNQTTLVKDHFLYALDDKLRLRVISGKPVTLEDTVNLAQATHLLSHKSSDSEVLPVDSPPIQDDVCFVRPRPHIPLRRPTYTRRIVGGVRRRGTPLRDMKSIQCYACHGFGHFQSVCPSVLSGPFENQVRIDSENAN